MYSDLKQLYKICPLVCEFSPICFFRISKLVEETVKERLQEEINERDKQFHEDQEKERLERDLQLEELKKAHIEELESLRIQMRR